MVSGIGPGDILEEFGVPVVSELEGVGQNIEACRSSRTGSWRIFADIQFRTRCGSAFRGV